MRETAGIYLVNKEGKILMCHPTNHRSDFYSIPKGGVDEGETYLDAAIRETYEETNISVSDFNIIHKLPPSIHKKGKKTLHSFILFEIENPFDFSEFDIKCNSNVPEEEGGFPEMDGFKWGNFEEAKEQLHSAQAINIVEIENLYKEITK